MLREQVATRAAAMEATHSPWPCRAGCDACCRRLGALLTISEVEFDALWSALQRLPPSVQREVATRVAASEPDAQGHYVCPLLDTEAGRCRVYAARPIACRTYGYYAGRNGDYWCERVTEHVGERRGTLVAGNQLAVDRERDQALGASMDLRRWFASRGPPR